MYLYWETKSNWRLSVISPNHNRPQTLIDHSRNEKSTIHASRCPSLAAFEMTQKKVRAPKRFARILGFLKSGQRNEQHDEFRMHSLPLPSKPMYHELSAMPIEDINPIAVVAPELSPEPNVVVENSAGATDIDIPVDEGRSIQTLGMNWDLTSVFWPTSALGSVATPPR
jgi:hypothetical protein